MYKKLIKYVISMIFIPPELLTSPQSDANDVAIGIAKKTIPKSIVNAFFMISPPDF